MSGFVVVQEDAITSERYLGVARYVTWPLELLKDPRAQLLSHDTFLRSVNSLLPLTLSTAQTELLAAYLQCCFERKLSIKLFYLCALESDRLALAGVHSLGWDYLASLDLSYLYDDGSVLFSMDSRKLSEVKMRMTESGLFGTRHDAEQYAAVRRRLDCNALGLEYTGEEYFVETFSVPPTAFLS